MSMRISSPVSFLAPLILLAACQSQPAAPGNGLAQLEAESNAQAEDDGRIVCAPAGNAAFARQCTVERSTSDGGLNLTVRRPDGGFHRLLVTRDGRGVVAADGAEKAKVTIIGANEIEVEIGGDRFRLPATVKPKSGK